MPRLLALAVPQWSRWAASYWLRGFVTNPPAPAFRGFVLQVVCSYQIPSWGSIGRISRPPEFRAFALGHGQPRDRPHRREWPTLAKVQPTAGSPIAHNGAIASVSRLAVWGFLWVIPEGVLQWRRMWPGGA